MRVPRGPSNVLQSLRSGVQAIEITFIRWLWRKAYIRAITVSGGPCCGVIAMLDMLLWGT